MGVYRARDLLLPPNLISLTRVPLAAAFVLALRHPALELAVLAVAGATDVLDGWWARRYGQTTATGSVVDPLSDKLFVLTVAASLVASGRLDALAVLLLAMRDIGELPLVILVGREPAPTQGPGRNPKANVTGKIATSAQFLAVALALFRSPFAGLAIGLAAVAGALAAISYWFRELRQVRAERRG